jgi:hypothetical protein
MYYGAKCQMHKESEFNNGKFWHQLFGKRFQPSAFKIKMVFFGIEK